MMEQTLTLPEKVNMLIGALEAHGFEAYAVGGCVRDALLHRDPNDWDITTDASPAQVKQVFGHTVDTGIAHGTVTVLSDDESFEVTTYRIDGVYEDARHPKEVTYTSSLEEDLRRRDFTINAMAYNPRTGLVDLFGGMQDLSGGIVRCVGRSEERFAEDALRILRAVRFSAQLNFGIAEETMRAAAQMAPNLSKISAERIRSELHKILLSDHPERIRTAWELQITRQALPVFDRMMELALPAGKTVGEHTVETLQEVPADRFLRWTMLLHDCGKVTTVSYDSDGTARFPDHAAAGSETAKRIMRGLKMDRETMDTVSTLIRWHTFLPEENEAAVRQAVHRIGEKLFPLYLDVKRADVTVREEPVRSKRLDALEKIVHIYNEITARGDCVSLRSMNLSGKDLIRDGMEGGPRMGEILGALLEEVLLDPSKNDRDYLLARSRELAGNISGKTS